ncbi:Ras-related protein Rab-28 [Orchesella cincta]|uniref:Ras-related protein Rab-28 n=1 Tax=Orchesella cincta TaxID=48709 RepID=A0A1D2N8X2_ORCCI|nr:Ras-related protein Rab-28 [Orchesella cincta]
MELEGKQVRIGVIGAPCIGKSCVVKRFVENSFHGSQYNPTPGVDFYSRRMSVKPLGTVTLIIIDIAGSAISSKMLPIYLHGIDVFLFTYDMTNTASLNELRKWVTVVYGLAEEKHLEPSVALVGSKGDLEHLRTVRLDAHTRFAQEFNIQLSFLVSAKSGESVQTCFTKCAIYHLSPEAKQRVREHAMLPMAIPKRQSLPAQNHPMAIPQPPGTSAGILNPTTTSAAMADPNSTVCSVQ